MDKGMQNQNGEQQVTIDGVRYILVQRDYDLLGNILARGRIVSADVKKEILTEEGAKRLLGGLYPYVLYYNHDAGKWSSDTYNGYSVDCQFIGTQYSKDLKNIMENLPQFGNLYELVANLSITVDAKDFPGNGKWANNVKHSASGAAVLGNMIVRSRKSGNLELWNSAWMGVDIYRSPSDAASSGAPGFAADGVWNAAFRAALIAGRVR